MELEKPSSRLLKRAELLDLVLQRAWPLHITEMDRSSQRSPTLPPDGVALGISPGQFKGTGSSPLNMEPDVRGILKDHVPSKSAPVPVRFHDVWWEGKSLTSALYRWELFLWQGPMVFLWSTFSPLTASISPNRRPEDMVRSGLGFRRLLWGSCFSAIPRVSDVSQKRGICLSGEVCHQWPQICQAGNSTPRTFSMRVTIGFCGWLRSREICGTKQKKNNPPKWRFRHRG